MRDTGIEPARIPEGKRVSVCGIREVAGGEPGITRNKKDPLVEGVLLCAILGSNQ